MKKKRSTQSKARIKAPVPANDALDKRAGRHGGQLFPIVGIGASAGGLEAFTQLLKHLPLDTGMAFVLVQHLDPVHESALTQILGRTTSLPVREVTDKLRVQANHVYVIPPDASLNITQGVLSLQKRPPTRIPHRPIDTFFESLAQDQRDRAIGVVLSGTASDGTLGLEAIKAEGGITFAQDASAKHDSMPRSAVAAGCVDLVLSPVEIAKELTRIAKHPYVAGQSLLPGLSEIDRADATAHEDDEMALPSGGKRSPRTDGKRARAESERGREEEAESKPAKGAEENYKRILLLLRNHSGVDFSLYRSTTIQRRIARRLVLNKKEALEDYAGFLRGNANELDALYSDVLISVTSFFRNPESFDTLQREVLPKILKQRSDDPVRVWVLGCSTGQEAYSIAIAFIETAEKANRMRRLQVFATDLNDKLLDKARHGLYAKSLAEDISPERLRRFFVEEQGGYRVSKMLREMVVFAKQNLISDPPFSRVDLISCRNLLIYLEPSLQRKALPTFHYALKPDGFLVLGASESIGGFTDLFEPVDKKHKIYSKKPAPTPAFHLPVRKGHMDHARTPLLMQQPEAPAGVQGEQNAQREADRLTVHQFAPSGVLINAQLQVLQFRGPTGAYLQPPAGKASFDVLKMAREGLMMPLRAAIEKAKHENKAARTENVSVKSNGETRTINLQVIPLKNLPDRYFLIVFEEADGRALLSERHTAPRISKEEEPHRIVELERELAESRDYLQCMQEEYEAANEELQAANEEVQSANEELQSINEELETSKEELESANEELTTVNEEMSNRNVELNRLNTDLINLQNSAKLAIVLLGRDLTIRRFSIQAEKLFDLLATDVGRPIGHVRHNLVLTPQAGESTPESQQGLESLVAEVVADLREQEREVRDKGGRWYSLRVRPYLTLDGKVDGAVLVLVDITERTQAQQKAAHLAQIVASSNDAIFSKNLDGTITSWNKGAERLFGYSTGEIIGKPGALLMPPDRVDEEAQVLERIRRGESVEHYEIVRQHKDGSLLDISLSASPITDAAGQVVGASKVARDISDRKLGEKKLRESEIRYRRLFQSAKDGILILDAQTGKITDANAFMSALVGLEPQELLGKDLFEIGMYKDVEENKEAFHELQKNRYLRHEHLPVRNRRGEQVDVELIANVYEEDYTLVAQCNVRDISQRVEMENRIKQQAELLAGESRRKDEFLAMLSHELRNPLAPIRSAVHLLKLHERGTENLIQRQAREIIERQVGNLSKLVNDLLEVSRVVSGRIRLDRQMVDLRQVVEHAIETTRSLIEHRKHTLTVHPCSDPVWINADATRIEEVLVNLLNNSAKYTDDGGTIEVWCEHSWEQNCAQLKVRDNGIGIDEKLLPRIFDLFTQADRSIDRSAGGLGIGLSLAHRLVDLHGGTIEAQSPPEGEPQGSEFIVRLPLAPAPESVQLSVTADETRRLEGLRVLVVDDNIDSAMMLASSLRNEGYAVQSAYTGPDGLQVAQRWRPDIVILDIGLPGLDGYEVARRLRATPEIGQAAQEMRLIALTGYGRDTDIALAREAGFDAHLTKPFEFDELEKLMVSRPDEFA